MSRWRSGDQVVVSRDVGTTTLDPIPDGAVCKVCDDFGQPYVNVYWQGQLRTVKRGSLRVAT